VCVEGLGEGGALVRWWVRVFACSLTNQARSAPPYCHLRSLWLHYIFRHYLINGTIFEKKVIGHKMCVLILSVILFVIYLILRRIQRDIVINVKTSSCKEPVIFFRILVKLRFSRQIFEKSLISSFIKIRPEGGELFHAARETNRRAEVTKLLVAFRNLEKGLKISYHILVVICT
jgi:hypothetical protein